MNKKEEKSMSIDHRRNDLKELGAEKTDAQVTLQELKEEVLAFTVERDWLQFHTPKNIATALSCEAAELLEFFLWTKDSESQRHLEKHREEIMHEVADVFTYVLSFCVENNIDLASAFAKKMELNRKKYPVERAKGSSAKYTAYHQDEKKETKKEV